MAKSKSKTKKLSTKPSKKVVKSSSSKEASQRSAVSKVSKASKGLATKGKAQNSKTSVTNKTIAPSTKTASKPIKTTPPTAKKPTVEPSAPQVAPTGVDATLYQKWLQYKKKYGHIEAQEYDMKSKYEEKTPLMHPKLGWGFILSIENDRLQVLFAQGIKVLISNYNPEMQI